MRWQGHCVLNIPVLFIMLSAGAIIRRIYFKNDRDKEKFLEYLDKAAERFSIIIHTYCLMSNHYHLLVETPEANLSLEMRIL